MPLSVSPENQGGPIAGHTLGSNCLNMVETRAIGSVILCVRVFWCCLHCVEWGDHALTQLLLIGLFSREYYVHGHAHCKSAIIRVA